MSTPLAQPPCPVAPGNAVLSSKDTANELLLGIRPAFPTISAHICEALTFAALSILLNREKRVIFYIDGRPVPTVKGRKDL